MLEKVLKTLEYDKIRTMVAERTQCCTGRELAEAWSRYSPMGRQPAKWP